MCRSMSRRCSNRPTHSNAPAQVIEQLLDEPVYRKHLLARGNHQYVMIGYSASNKDSGIVHVPLAGAQGAGSACLPQRATQASI